MPKHLIKSFLISIIILELALLPCAALASPADYSVANAGALTEDQLYGQAALLMDANTGNILFSKNAEAKMYPASTTKIMTLLLACESGWSLDMEVTIPSEAADIAEDSSLIPVYPGEKMAFGDLLYGMMMHSGNDGANAIAVLVGGSIENFVAMMNARAQEIGCTGTHFANAHGYHDENHYSTALDLARIAQVALQNETFRTISSTYKRTITITGTGETRTLELTNRNVMLNPNSEYYLEGCIGIKTGSHNAAGQCFVGAVDKDDITLITVSLKCSEETEKWVDTFRLARYGYTRYTDYPIERLFDMISPQIATTKVANAKSNDANGGILQFKLAQISDPDFSRKVQSDDPKAVTDALKDFSQRITITLDQTPVAPITEGQALGTFTYTKQNGEVITATLIAGASIEAEPAYAALFDLFPFLRVFENVLVRLLAIVLILLVVVVILALRAKKRREKKRRMELYRRRRNAYRMRDREQERAAQKKAVQKKHGAAVKKRPAGAAPSKRTAQTAPAKRKTAPKKKPAPKEPEDIFDIED